MAADPVVSPADTIRRIMELTKAHREERFDDVAREIHGLAESLLAVGERDRWQIARLASGQSASDRDPPRRESDLADGGAPGGVA